MRQQGFAYVWLMALLGLVAAYSVGIIMTGEQARSSQADPQRRAWLLDAAARLASWYERNSLATGAQAGQIDMAQALAGAGIVPRYGLQTASSRRQTDGLVSWHVLALWLPEPDSIQGTALDPATGAFNVGTTVAGGQPANGLIHAVVDGHATQLRLYAESGRRMRSVGSRLENRFAAMRATHPMSPAATNWFRASNCAAALGEDMPCYDAYQALDTTVLPAAAGIPPSLAINAWGAPVEASNLADSSLVSPFAMSLRTALPWGGWMQILVQEP